MRRKQLGIVIEILKILSSQEKFFSKTQVMYRANLNFYRASEYLETLYKLGLVEKKEAGNKELFSITKKGKEFLMKIDEALKFLKTEKGFAFL